MNRELKTITNLGLYISIIAAFTIAAFFFIFQKLVIIPISKLSSALDTYNGKPIESLLKSSGEFKKVAEEKMKELNGAYDYLKNKLGE